MNFGQSFPGPATPLPYQITIASEEFVRRLADFYEQAVREELADAPYHGTGETPVLDRWRELGYPPLSELLAREPALVEGLLKDWFGQEALDRIVPGPDQGLPRFLINTINQVTVRAGQVHITGTAYAHPQLVSQS